MNNKTTDMLTRVNKTAAKNLWNAGIPLVCTSAGLNPEHPYTPMTFCTPRYDFQCIEDMYKDYACLNGETGEKGKKYAAYYVPTKMTLHITFTDGFNPYVYYNASYKELVKNLKAWNESFNIVHADYINHIGNYKTYMIELVLQPKI